MTNFNGEPSNCESSISCQTTNVNLMVMLEKKVPEVISIHHLSTVDGTKFLPTFPSLEPDYFSFHTSISYFLIIQNRFSLKMLTKMPASRFVNNHPFCIPQLYKDSNSKRSDVVLIDGFSPSWIKTTIIAFACRIKNWRCHISEPDQRPKKNKLRDVATQLYKLVKQIQ